MVKRCDAQSQDGAGFCGTTRRTLPPWTCSSFRPLASICSMHLFIVRLDRIDLVWINVTTSPTAEWVERQLNERPTITTGRPVRLQIVDHQLVYWSLTGFGTITKSVDAASGDAIDHSRAVTRSAHTSPFRPATIRDLNSYIGGCGAAVGTVARPSEGIPEFLQAIRIALDGAGIELINSGPYWARRTWSSIEG